MNVAKVISAVQIALIFLAVILCVRALMVFFTPQSNWTPLPLQVGPQEGSAALPQGVNTGTINTSFDPFFRETAIKTTPAVAPRIANIGEDAPETTLDLTLMGRRAGTNGSAILRTPDGVQKNYAIGDEILSNVTLEAVNVEYIVLSQNGSLERLTFMRDTENNLRQVQEINSNSNAKPKAAPQNVNYSSNPLLDLVNFSPERENSHITGYKIVAKQAGLSSALPGLEDGDVITSIGRIALQDEDIDFGAVLTRLQNRRSTNVELIRNGQAISVKVGTP
ncbi:MAG: type II secretion system protein N [Litorimonas sp.]